MFYLGQYYFLIREKLMKYKFVKVIKLLPAFIIALAFLQPETVNAAASGYISVHDFPYTYTWKDEQGVTRSEVLQGVRDRGNPNLPQVLCRNYYCPPRETVNILDLTQDMSPQILQFRLFVPPGTVYTNLLLYMARDVSCASVARFGSPPIGVYTDYDQLSYADDYDGATLQEVIAGEMTAVNRGGTMQIIADRSETPLFQNYHEDKPYTAGGWLYVRLILFNGNLSSFYRISWTNYVNFEIYKNWYNSMSETDWYNFNSVQASLNAPSAVTGSAGSVARNAATLSGEVINDGGAFVYSRGICWGMTPAPDLSGSVISYGTGTGKFSFPLNGLSPHTTYYYRAYATNAMGSSYGYTRSFTTINQRGNVNNDTEVDLADAILVLKILSGVDVSGETILREADVNGNRQLEMAEVLYILQKVGNIR